MLLFGSHTLITKILLQAAQAARKTKRIIKSNLVINCVCKARNSLPVSAVFVYLIRIEKKKKQMIRDNLKKYLLPGALAAMTYDSWYQSSIGPQSTSVLKIERDSLLAQNKKANSELADITARMEECQDRNLILKAKAQALLEEKEAIISKSEEIESIKSKLMVSGLTESQKSEIHHHLEYKKTELFRLIKQNTNSARDLHSTEYNGGSNVFNNNNVTQQNLSSLQKTNLDSTNQIIESNNSKPHAPSDSTSSEIKEQSFLGNISEMKESYNEFISELSSEQLGCLTNTFGFLMILGGMVTITLILFGETIIKHLKIEAKYPKIARYIKLRQTVNNYYLIFNIIMIYFIIIIYIIINIYMLIM